MTRPRGFLMTLTFCGLLAFATSAHAECAWALWAYQTNRAGVDVIRNLQRVFTTRDECRAHGAGWAEKMREFAAARSDDPVTPKGLGLTWSWNCNRIPEGLYEEDKSRHPVGVPR
jgi:hypothetical protein